MVRPRVASAGVGSPVVRLATRDDHERILDTVMAAFAGDPAFRYFFPTQASYAEEGPLFVGELLDQRLTFGTVWVVDDAAAVAMWNPPHPARTDLPGALSPETVARINRFDAVVHALLPREPHWYLGILATHPDHAGKGHGRLAMAAGLELARADGLPGYLETVTDVNVGIYERYGWHVTATVEVAGVEVRIMRTP
jgi:GNAT superfamily N-acetyltransferase